MTSFMSQWKAVHWHDQIQAFRKDELAYPRMLQIDPMSACNHDCGFCTYRYGKDEDFNALMDFKDSIPYPKMVEILEDAREMGVKAIELTGGGEPSLHPQFAGILHSIEIRGFDFGVITNGVGSAFFKDNDEVIDRLSRATWIRFSINGATSDSYARVHKTRGSHFYKALKIVEQLVACKSENTTVGISFVIQHENFQELERIANISQDLGCDYLRVAGMIFPETTVHHEVYKSYYPDLFRKKVEADLCIIKDNFDIPIIDNFSERLGRQGEGEYKDEDFCYSSVTSAVIGADQRLYPCCLWKYRPQGVIGSLRDTRLKDLWESGQRAEYYRNLNISEMCGTCYYKPKNDFIKDLVSENMEDYNNNPDFIAYKKEHNPPHVNFI